MPRIFISYRRTDTIGVAGRIHDRLVTAFGEKNVFKDVDDIPLGADFREVLDEEVDRCDVLLALIGPAWLKAADERGNRRIDDPNDFVRIEIESALKRDKLLVVPVLVGYGTSMPAASDLPEGSIRTLVYRNAAIVRDDPDFSRDMVRLVEQIKRSATSRQQTPVVPTRRFNPLVVGGAVVAMLAVIVLLLLSMAQTPNISSDDETATSAAALVAVETATDHSTDTPSPTIAPSDTPTDTLTPTIVPSQTPTYTPLPSDTPGTGTANSIRRQGVIRVGINDELSWPFNTVDESGNLSGFEIELANELVRRLFDTSVRIEWIPVMRGDRQVALQNGSIDLLIRLTTHTVTRAQAQGWGLWTRNYFLDGQRLLVSSNSGVNSLADLNGRTIAAVAGSIPASNLPTIIRQSGLNIQTASFSTVEAAFDGVFESNQADAVTDDWSELLSVFSRGPAGTFEVVGPLLSKEPFAIALPFGSEDFRDEIDIALLSIINDGTWMQIYNTWFPAPPPWTLEEMLAEPPANR